MFCRRKDRKKMIQCKENGIFFEKIIRCEFNACQINLSEFNTSRVIILGFQKQKNEGKIASYGREISKTIVCSKQNALLQ
jgi:hypothetical protein